MGVVLSGAMSGRYGPARISTPANVALFWHFVDAIWVVLFLALFVL